jgi:inosine-uridine nucleoside N-ribohydrolase
MPPSGRAKLLIDCDPGHDDAIALLLAAEVAELLGISTVTGNAPLEQVTDNALKILELIGLDVPVHAGAAQPLVGEAVHAPHVHGASGLGGTSLPAAAATIASADAAGHLLEQTRLTPGCWVVAIGPLTNLALALRQDAGLIERIAGISIMGGSTSGGNITATAEFNIFADPLAAAEVFASGARLRMCGLNLTHQLTSSPALLDRILAHDDPRARLVGEILTFLHRRMEELTGYARAALHDPCAVLAVTHPELFDFQPRHVAVEVQGELTRGMTIVDERAGPARAVANVEVAYRIDAPAALRLILDALGIRD